MIQNNFFIISPQYNKRYARAIERSDQFVTKSCIYCGAVFDERKSKHFQVSFCGKNEGDYYYAPTCNIASQKLINLLYENCITGFLARDLDCYGWYDAKNNPLLIDWKKYKEIVVTGRAGYLRFSDGTIATKCDKCHALKRRLISGKVGGTVGAEWDGSDIFYFDNWEGVMIVTERVKKLIETVKLKNIEFQLLSEYCFDPLIKNV